MPSRTLALGLRPCRRQVPLIGRRWAIRATTRRFDAEAMTFHRRQEFRAGRRAISFDRGKIVPSIFFRCYALFIYARLSAPADEDAARYFRYLYILFISLCYRRFDDKYFSANATCYSFLSARRYSARASKGSLLLADALISAAFPQHTFITPAAFHCATLARFARRIMPPRI